MKKRKILVCAVGMLVFTAISVFLSLWIGARVIPFREVLDILLGRAEDSIVSRVVMARIPRTVFGLVAGGALGVSGAIMQSITRNPVADPSILGVNTGAALAVVCGLVFLNISTPEEYIWLAMLGAGLTTALVYGIASLGPAGITPLKLALSGATVSTALGSMLSTVLLPDSDAMNSSRFWQLGSVGAASWDTLVLLLPFFAVGIILAMLLAEHMNMVALGDEMAASLGVNVSLVRFLSCAAGVILCGATTALAGPIGFIGLMVPHLLRIVIGSDMRVILPMSVLSGGGLLLISDVIGRVLGRPGETEVGIITALLGAPVFIYVVLKEKVKSL